jgi:MATE family multidrug resistance protein
VLAPRMFITPFAKGADAASMIEIGTRMMMLSAAWQLFDAASMTLSEALRAAGDTAYTLWVRTAIAWGLFFPGSYITVRVLKGNDVHAVAWVVVYLGLLAALLWLRFRSGKWRDIALTGSEHALQPDDG